MAEFNSSNSWVAMGMAQRVRALWVRACGVVLGTVQRFALVRWRVARMGWRDLGRTQFTFSQPAEAATGSVGGGWWQSPESQRTTVRRRAGV